MPEVLHGGSATACHLVQEVEDTLSIYLRKTVEKHNISKNYEVRYATLAIVMIYVNLSIGLKGLITCLTIIESRYDMYEFSLLFLLISADFCANLLEMMELNWTLGKGSE